MELEFHAHKTTPNRNSLNNLLGTKILLVTTLRLGHAIIVMGNAKVKKWKNERKRNHTNENEMASTIRTSSHNDVTGCVIFISMAMNYISFTKQIN